MYVSAPGDPSPPSTSNFIPEFPSFLVPYRYPNVGRERGAGGAEQGVPNGRHGAARRSGRAEEGSRALEGLLQGEERSADVGAGGL